MSHTKTVLVSNDAGATATSVASGKLVAFVDGTATASTAPWAAINASGSAAKTFQFQTGEGSSLLFKGADVKSSTIQEYAAGTQQILEVTPVIEADKSAYIKLINVTEGREKFTIATFEAVGAADNAAAVDQLVSAINASKRDIFADVVAAEKSGATTVIQITMPVNVNMRGAANDASSAVTNATPAAFSIGAPADVNAEVQAALPIQGVTNIAGPNVVKPAVVTGSNTYDRTCLFVEQTHGDRTDIHEIVLYTLSGNTTLNATLDTFLA